jgi:hypothetical protein
MCQEVTRWPKDRSSPWATMRSMWSTDMEPTNSWGRLGFDRGNKYRCQWGRTARSLLPPRRCRTPCSGGARLLWLQERCRCLIAGGPNVSYAYCRKPGGVDFTNNSIISLGLTYFLLWTKQVSMSKLYIYSMQLYSICWSPIHWVHLQLYMSM